MNSSQVRSFLATVEKLSFTRASQQLFISQPGLSRQIAAMEKELGVKLFTRGRNSIQITEAGKVCEKYLTRIHENYTRMLSEATKAQQNQEKLLIIGGLEGQLIGKCYENILSYFWTEKPKTDLQVCYYSASRLCEVLMDGKVDIAILPEPEVEHLPGIEWKVARKDKCCLVVPRNHPKSNVSNPTLLDFSDETFLVLAESDSSAIAKQHKRICEAAGFKPKQRTVSTFGTLATLLEMGVGISVLNIWHSLGNNPNLKFLDVPEVGYRREVVAWRADSQNPSIEDFINQIPDENSIEE